MHEEEWQKEFDRLDALSKLARDDIARLEQVGPSLDLIKAYERIAEISVRMYEHLKSKFF
ncbi:hypothetical protein [Dyella mobilis]|uniref:Uncharacterized protein n=1 Tax=Dyella mobilis TaxID=1849582 RepID=A0ABS2KE02_9GAMM|nr:hypothetical protein [Dyella mobilis]MBM7129406.1 hypothetical protein [Dyella mobilis]GLQ98329.1 hypothetical protein GCM10007863_27490 [Dyella mobilis]